MLKVLSALAPAPLGAAAPPSEPGPRNQPSGHSPIRSAYRRSLSSSSLPGRRPAVQIVAMQIAVGQIVTVRLDVPPDRDEFAACGPHVHRLLRVDTGLLECAAYLVGALRRKAQPPP